VAAGALALRGGLSDTKERSWATVRVDARGDPAATVVLRAAAPRGEEGPLGAIVPAHPLRFPAHRPPVVLLPLPEAALSGEDEALAEVIREALGAQRRAFESFLGQQRSGQLRFFELREQAVRLLAEALAGHIQDETGD
jgi:hypothetical protein